MDFRDLLDTLRRFWRISALVAIVIVGLGAVAAFVPQKEYQTTSTIILEFAPDVEVSIQQVNFILPGLEEQARSRTLRTDAAARVSEAFRNRPAVISATADASVVRVSANTTSPRAAQEWADAVALELIEQRNAGSGPLELALLDPAPLRRAPVAPNVVPIMLAAAVVAFVSAVFAALLASRFLSAIRGDDRSLADVSAAERERMHWRGIDPFDRVRSRSEAEPDAMDEPDDSDDNDLEPPSGGDAVHGAYPGPVEHPDLHAQPEWASATEGAGRVSRAARRRSALRLAAPMFIFGGVVAAGILIVR